VYTIISTFPPPLPKLTRFCGSFLEHLHESFLELVFVERTLNPFSWIVPWTCFCGKYLEPIFVARYLVSLPCIMSNEDNRPISQLFVKKSKNPNNLNEDDQPIIQQF
jgi:hypothetical protein